MKVVRNKIEIILLLCALGAIGAGCSVTSSTLVLDHADGAQYFKGCASRLGSYALPRRVLNVVIHREGDDFILKKLETEAVPDNAHNYCFEHDDNPFAEDAVRVYKNKINLSTDTQSDVTETTKETTPYLQLVASKAVDHTAAIIRNFIRAAFIGISNNPDFPGRAAVGTGDSTSIVVADHQVDPFNYREMAKLNQSIRRYGFCIVLGRYSFNVNQLDPSSYCDSPSNKAEHNAPPSDQAIQEMRWHGPKPTSGIFYRPRAPYRVEVYTKHYPDHDNDNDWTLALMKTLHMENIMPLIAVGVRRELFAERRTGLIFDDGELLDVCISKGNNIEGATNIVLDVVYGIINLPSATIEATIDDLTNQKKLAEKRTELINAQEEYIKFLEGKQEAKIEEKKATALNLDEKTDMPTANRPSETVPTTHAILEGDEKSNALNNICAKLKVAQVPNASGSLGGL